MMIIFVVGPSRGGKTTLLSRVLPGFSALQLLDLDAEENRIQGNGGGAEGWEGRWRRNLGCLRRLEASGGDFIVDVGAGSLQTAEGRRFFVQRGQFAIAVVAPWALVLSRHPGRNQEEFRQTEYSQEREQVYQAARFRVDSNTCVEESARKFQTALHELLNRSERR